MLCWCIDDILVCVCGGGGERCVVWGIGFVVILLRGIGSLSNVCDAGIS